MTQDLRSPGGRLALPTGCEEKQVDPDAIGAILTPPGEVRLGREQMRSRQRNRVLSVRLFARRGEASLETANTPVLVRCCTAHGFRFSKPEGDLEALGSRPSLCRWSTEAHHSPPLSQPTGCGPPGSGPWEGGESPAVPRVPRPRPVARPLGDLPPPPPSPSEKAALPVLLNPGWALHVHGLEIALIGSFQGQVQTPEPDIPNPLPSPFSPSSSLLIPSAREGNCGHRAAPQS